MDTDAFSEKFKKDLVQYYTAQKVGKEIEIRGNLLGNTKKGDDMNISPALSPDGKYVAYISSKNVISLDIYVADVETGKTIRKIESGTLGAHVDSYSFIETSGTWSQDSRKFAIVIQTKGKNKLLVIDVINGEKKEFSPKNIEAFTNPAWSPDGNKIVISGINQGQSDLYLFDTKSQEVINITNDEYSDIQPCWSPDAKKIYFVSDRGGKGIRLEKENFKISELILETGKTKTIDLFENTDNMNPQISPDGLGLYFISSPNGFKDIYKFNISSGKVTKLSNYFTGISGITMYSPAFSVASQTGEIAYNYFNKGEYNIVIANETHFLNQEVSKNPEIDASILAPGKIMLGMNIVQQNLDKTWMHPSAEKTKTESQTFKPNFKLEYLANSGMGLSSSRFGTGMGGGITALFSDMLNNNQLMGTIALNGGLQNFGGQAFYLNQKHPFQYGVSVSHIPYSFVGKTDIFPKDTLGRRNNLDYYNGEIVQKVINLYVDQFSTFVFKPFSKSTRMELGFSQNWYYYGVNGYPSSGEFGLSSDGNVYDYNVVEYGKQIKLKAKDLGLKGFNLTQIYAAIVGDKTTFGTVAPLNGYRYRLEMAKYIGSTSYNSVLADFRKYKYLKPITIAGRFLYEGRLNPKNLELLNQINPLYMGYPWYMHGFYGRALTKQIGYITQANLQGEQMAVANFEIRLPLTGPKKLALIPLEFIPSDLNFFLDGGLVWSKQRKIGESYLFESFGSNAINFKTSPIYTTGMSLRINVLGYLIVEPYIALPIYNGQKQAILSGFNFMIAGW